MEQQVDCGAKDLRIAGIDYDARYIKAAERRVAQDAKLRDRVSVVCASVYDGQVLPRCGPRAASTRPTSRAHSRSCPTPSRPCRPWPPSSGRACASSCDNVTSMARKRAGAPINMRVVEIC